MANHVRQEIPAGHPALTLSNSNAPLNWNAITQTLNIPVWPKLAITSTAPPTTTYTYTPGDGSPAVTFTTHPAMTVTNTAAPFAFNAITQALQIPQAPTYSVLGNTLTITPGTGAPATVYTPTIPAGHPAAVLTNNAAPFAWNTATQAGNIPQPAALTQAGSTYTFTNGAGGPVVTFTIPATHPAMTVTNNAAPFAFNAAAQALQIPQVPTLTSPGSSVLTYNNGTGVPSTTLTLPDFWRSSAGGTTLPDGTADVTENIRRDGRVGVVVDPLTTMDVNGSFSAGIVNTSAASYTVLDTDYTINLTLATSQTVVVPAASAFPRRILNIRNQFPVAKVFSPNYTETTGVAGHTYIPPFSSITVQSNGTNWLLIGEARERNGYLRPYIGAYGTIDLGDPIPAGTRPVTTAFNIASATGLDTTGGQARCQVNFASAMLDTRYIIIANLRSNVPGGWINDTTLHFNIVSKTTTGFVFSVREIAGVIQNISLDFQIQVAI